MTDARTRDSGQALPGASRKVNDLSDAMKGTTSSGNGNGGGGGGTTTTPTVGSVVVTPAAVTLAVGATRRFSAQVLDTHGQPVSGVAVSWGQQALTTGALVSIVTAGTATRDVTVTSAGTAAPGTSATVRIDATAGGITGTATITIPVAALPDDPAPPPPPTPPASALSVSASAVTFTGTAASATETGGGAAYYVAPTGSSGNAGTAASPWSLAYALSGAGGAIGAGATVWLAAGTYTGTFTSTLAGTAAAPIVVRAAAGARVIVDGSLTVDGADVWVWGLEVTNSAASPSYVTGLDVFGPRVRVINCVVHDAPADGLGLWEAAPDAQAYGCILYNNGRVLSGGAYGHGCYVQNATGAKTLRHNVVFNSFAYGLHCYGEDAQLAAITLDANVVFESGRPAGQATPNVLLGGANAVSGGRVTDNVCWTSATDGTNVSLGYTFGSTANGDAVLSGNTIVGGKPALRVLHFTTLTASGNTLASASPYELVNVQGATAGHTWSANTHYRVDDGNGWVVGASAGPFAFWQATVPAASDTRPASAPSGTVVTVHPNAYEAGRAHVAVRNPANATTASVDLSHVLSVGDTYTVHNVRDLFGSPVLAGTYAGGSVTLPLAATANPVPVGGFVGGTPSSTLAFQTYLVRKTSGGTASTPATDPAAQAVTWSNPAGLTGLSVAEVVDAPWLAVSTLLGTTTATTTLAVTTGTLTAGTYTATVRGTQGGASGSPVSVAVTFTVNPAPASPLPPSPGTDSSALALTAYRDPRASAGTASDRSKNGVPLPRSGFTVTASELGSLLVEVDGVEVSCYVEAHVQPRADGTLPVVWLEYAPGALAAGASRTGVVLRKGTPTRPRLTKQGNTFARDLANGLYANGVMPCYSFASQAATIDSQFLDEGVQIPTAAEIAALSDVRLASAVTRFAGHVEPFWTSTATFPGTSTTLTSPYAADRLTTAYWPSTGSDYFALRENLLIRGGQYEMAAGLRHHWLASWDFLSFRRACSTAWFYTVQYLLRQYTLSGGNPRAVLPGEPYQGPDSAYFCHAIMGEVDASQVLALLAEFWYDGGYTGGYGRWAHINGYDATNTRGFTAYRSLTDPRQCARALTAMRRAWQAKRTTSHSGEARDWGALYQTGRAKLTERGADKAIRSAPGAYGAAGGLLYADGVCPDAPDAYYVNTWMGAQLCKEVEAGLVTFPDATATGTALRATVDGLLRYYLTGPRYTTTTDGYHTIAINQSDDACGLSVDGGQIINGMYGGPGYLAATRVGGADGATMTSRLDTLLHDTLRGDSPTTDLELYYGGVGKFFNEVFSFLFLALGRKIHG
jgi:hypothetical protein